MQETLTFLDDWLLRAVTRAAGHPALAIQFEGRCPAIEAPAVVYRDRAALLRSILEGESGFGDGFASGRIRVEGDLVAVLEELYRSRLAAEAGRWSRHVLRPRRRNSPRAARRNIHRHYDIGTDFYRLWLDDNLIYTCAYYDQPEMTLEQAQEAKLDLICRKLHLRPGETVVEAGCGWGSAALYMARNYGVMVRAFNISRDQIAWARRRVRQEGLTGRVEFIEDDYRAIDGHYDVFVSIGMLEHVGVAQYRELGRVIHRCLNQSGRGLMHFIGRDHPEPLSEWITQRIFPGAYVPSLAEALPLLERGEYAVLDVENLRPHYAHTLEHWLQRYLGSYDRVVSMFGEEFARAWHLYLAGSVAAFRVGTLQLYQVLFAGRECAQLPWSRKHLYLPTLEAPCAVTM